MPEDNTFCKKKKKKRKRYSFLYANIEGSRPEWCVSSMVIVEIHHSGQTPSNYSQTASWTPVPPPPPSPPSSGTYHHGPKMCRRVSQTRSHLFMNQLPSSLFIWNLMFLKIIEADCRSSNALWKIILSSKTSQHECVFKNMSTLFSFKDFFLLAICLGEYHAYLCLFLKIS